MKTEHLSPFVEKWKKAAAEICIPVLANLCDGLAMNIP